MSKRVSTRSLHERVAGWIGFALLLGSFTLASFGVLLAAGLPYLIMNLLGAGIMGIVALKNRVYPALAIDVFWIALTLAGLVKTL